MNSAGHLTSWKISEVIRVIHERRAIRKFRPNQVNALVIDELLAAGRMAPSAMNMQPWQFYIVKDKELIKSFSDAILKSSKMEMIKAGLKKAGDFMLHPKSFDLKEGIKFLHEADPVFHGAPLVIFISSPIRNEWAPLDIGMCAQNIMLAATSLGLGSCPIGFAKFVEDTPLYNKLNVPKSHQINLAIAIGYPDEHPKIHERISGNMHVIS